MGRKKGVKNKVKVKEKVEAVEEVKVEALGVKQSKIAHVVSDFGRDDFNQLGYKLNEVIDYINSL